MITSEQRENIIKRLSYIKKNNLMNVMYIEDMEVLLSSEQAWREEAEKRKTARNIIRRLNER